MRSQSFRLFSMFLSCMLLHNYNHQVLYLVQKKCNRVWILLNLQVLGKLSGIYPSQHDRRSLTGVSLEAKRRCSEQKI